MRRIGFIGLGVMGQSMAKRLLNKYGELFIYTRSKNKAEALIEKGAAWCTSPKEVANQSQLIITMVGYPHDVEEVYLGEEGLIRYAQPGTIFIDMTTSKPELAERIYQAAKDSDHTSLDAPVTGGDIGAKEGTLSIMAGGDKAAFDEALPVLQTMGQNIVYQGEAGSGQHTKMCNQIAIATNMIGVCEAIVYGQKAGLNPEQVLKSISGGAAGSWSLSNLAPRILANNFEPGFYIKHFIKDMGIALEEAKRMELALPGLSLARDMYQSLAQKGYSDKGTQALYKYWSE
ncbi:3-hydroxyisobutyrate dehydrogenase [Bacillus oleivorans]|uniref:3-hydroxyisobutyrate dehydrogenase n=1 Tax=Bacillus oleivorans TaxID=1448271 RepID=A0A285D2M6_9BACI|nr:NAD(P)-dependent oxidoreductase [Bacillus oleivorans]SNX73915.1 3-hydroxyisobutyrate dehydrogenase [Bacillus oleivorans]